MHDSSVIELLWTSCGDPELVEAIEEEDVAMRVRTWIGELLSRSLLLGNAAGIHLHGACVNLSMQLPLALLSDSIDTCVARHHAKLSALEARQAGDDAAAAQGSEWYTSLVRVAR